MYRPRFKTMTAAHSMGSSGSVVIREPHASGDRLYAYGFHGQGKGRDRDAAPLDAER